METATECIYYHSFTHHSSCLAKALFKKDITWASRMEDPLTFHSDTNNKVIRKAKIQSLQNLVFIPHQGGNKGVLQTNVKQSLTG